MLYCTPVEGGYAYLEGSPPQPRHIRSGAIELAAPLLPLDCKAIATGPDAQGMIAFPQSRDQLLQLSRLPPPRPAIWTETPPKEPESLAGAIAKGALVSLAVRTLL